MTATQDSTHTLTISVPLNLEANKAAERSDVQGAFAQAMAVLLPVISLGTLGLQCGNVNVAVEETP